MKILIYFLSACISFSASAQISSYKKTVAMVPMRDGIKLNTVIYSPIGNNGPFPVLIQRTPYGAMDIPDSSDLSRIAYISGMAREGYIFAFQDIRGKFNSEGTMQIHTPLIHKTKPNAVDESTDTYDAIEWLIKNVPDNNGKAGLYGISYPGWLAMVGSVDHHPALKASSPQAQMGDLFLGDDFHHNGAFRLSYGMEYTYEVEAGKGDSSFPFPQYDLFNWYLNLGPLKNVNEKYFHNKIPTWNNFVKHPDYDDFWKENSPLSYVKYPEIPMLHVGGYFDQEDINGPQLMYAALEKKDSFNRNYICLGPWLHGQWNRSMADSLGKIAFESNTALWFQNLQKKWFDYWLKGIGDGNFAEASCFQTGSNEWKTYLTWPPKEATVKKLYAAADNTCSFTKPVDSTGSVTYTSDPANPIPYRTLPIEATYGTGSRWRPWHSEDQRFVYARPDVISFKGDSLTDELTVTGDIKVHLIASTNSTDADWVVKLIDLYPGLDQQSLPMSGFQLPVAMEVFRGRYYKSFETPTPLVPNQPTEFIIDLHQVNHVFKNGHHLMIQVQSTWFPVIDRNPQKFVPNIFLANEKDYIKAQHTIYCNAKYATYVELPVM